MQEITLGGGCFWCVEAVYELVDGVESVESGYANGHVDRPTYEQVCGGRTGHAEVVRVRFDEARISLREVLEIFFAVHDPTTPDRQGNDVGPQYRSAIYWHDAAQEPVVREVVREVTREVEREVAAQAQPAPGVRVVTELAPLRVYWPAEAYHQHYFARNPHQGYCSAVVGPKVAKFRKTFASRVRAA
jgi:peptide-methionine (S)-S-oxide reductase